MKRNLIQAAAFAATTLAISIAFAANPGQPDQTPQGQGDPMPMHSRMGQSSGSMCGGMMGRGMMGGGMMGMMGERASGDAMPGGQRMTTPGIAALPKLPPGNEKLEFQMQAEIMQKIGEIASRYAERIQQQ